MNIIIKAIRENPFFAIPILKWIKTKDYRTFESLLIDSETWTEEQVNEWQLNNVSALVDYAYEHVSGYKKKFNSVGYELGSIKNWSDFERLPFLTKEEIKNNFQEFCSNEKIPCHKAFTSGSTGKPMQFLLDTATSDREKAMFHYYWAKYGYNYGARCVLLRGQGIANVTKGIFFQYDRFQNYKMFDSTYASKSENIKVYDKEIRSFKADYMQAYPSALFSFSKIYERSGLEAPCFKTIFLGSEGVIPSQCEFIKKIFHAERVMYHYGLSECAALALKHPEEDKLCFIPVYGYTEIVREGVVQKAIGDTGEIVATGFNMSMPFIRYRTGDYTTIAKVEKDSFLRNCKVVDLIEGRKQEYVVTKTRRLIPVVWLCGQHMKTLDLVADFQYEQIEIGKLFVNVVVPGSGERDRIIISKLQNEYAKLLPDVDVQVMKVKEIAKNPRGKRISMIQMLDTDNFR